MSTEVRSTVGAEAVTAAVAIAAVMVMVSAWLQTASSAAPASQDPITSELVPCGGRAITISGTNADDTITGTPGDDVIAGFAGNDDIDGGAGDDIICGGDGGDVLRGGPGDDRLLGEAEDVALGTLVPDRLRGGPGDDYLDGGWDPNRADIRYGGDVIDYADVGGPVSVDLAAGTASGLGPHGTIGHDRIVKEPILAVRGSRYADVIRGTDTRNQIDGGDGADRIYAAGGADEVDRGQGASPGDKADDLVWLGPGNDTYSPDGGHDRVMGQSGNDTVAMGREFFDDRSVTAFGGPGDDRFAPEINTSGTVISGGGGRDEFRSTHTTAMPARTAKLLMDADRGVFTYGANRPGAVPRATGRTGGVERFVLSVYDRGSQQTSVVRFIGSDAAESVAMEDISAPLVASMGAGADQVLGSRYRDRLQGGSGYDRVRARAGRDRCLSFEFAENCEETS